MTKITGSFIALVFVIIFSSIVYIWKSEENQQILETQIATQQTQIATLESELKNTNQLLSDSGSVQGAENTATGILSGSINFSDPSKTEGVLVCAQETHVQQEFCTDIILNSETLTYGYSFEIPIGTYEVYLTIPIENKKIYYSEISTCDSESNCMNNSKNKRLIQISQQEKQQDINLSL